MPSSTAPRAGQSHRASLRAHRRPVASVRATLALAGCVLSLARPAHGGGPPGAGAAFAPLEPMAADPWWAPLGPTALYTPGDPPTARRGLWLGVSGGIASSPGERHRVFGLLELGLGIDRWLGASPAVGMAETSDDLGSSGSGLDDADDPDALAAPTAAARSSPAPLRVSLAPDPATTAGAARLDSESRSRGAPPHEVLEAADARSHDPMALAHLARATLAEAQRIHGGAAELRRLDGMASRSRAAASLPEVRLGAGTSRDESLRLNPTLSDPARFTRDGGRDLWLEARLTWRLDSAIFAHDELAILRLRAQEREESARLAREVLEALVDWQRARLLLAGDELPPSERDAAALRQFGAVARLDMLTDGWFSRQVAHPGRAGREPGWP